MNTILTIHPYRENGTWVFDDVAVGLVREPFVAGIPEMIDQMVADIPGAAGGFRLTFSAGSFPGTQATIEWVREEGGGNWYRWAERDMEGWLCPALFKYFDKAPQRIHMRADPATEERRFITVPRAQVAHVLELLDAGDIAQARDIIAAALA